MSGGVEGDGPPDPGVVGTVVAVVVVEGSTIGAVPRKMSKIGWAAASWRMSTLIEPTMVPVAGGVNVSSESGSKELKLVPRLTRSPTE